VCGIDRPVEHADGGAGAGAGAGFAAGVGAGVGAADTGVTGRAAARGTRTRTFAIAPRGTRPRNVTRTRRALRGRKRVVRHPDADVSTRAPRVKCRASVEVVMT